MLNVDWSKWNSKEDNFKKYSQIKSKLIYGTPQKSKSYDVSIVILTYKRADGLKEAINSAINQDYLGTFCIIVADDSGYDEATDLLMKRYCKEHDNILYYRHERNLGQYANWNRACELSPTDWYCLLHDDDILEKNYLKESMAAVSGTDLGLLGVYINVHDTREGSDTMKISFGHKVVNLLTNIFLSARNGSCIPLTLKDGVKHIYVMNSTFINKPKALETGGLDDRYFPSSDFAFAAKMSFYYSTGFLPARLTNKGIGESESLKQSVCDDSIKCSFYQTRAMCAALGYSERKQLRKASIAAVVSEIGVKGYNDVDYSKVKRSLGMKEIYSTRFAVQLINLYSKLNWGLLLFRKSPRKFGK